VVPRTLHLASPHPRAPRSARAALSPNPRPKKPTRVAAPSPRASLGHGLRYADARSSVGRRRFRSITKLRVDCGIFFLLQQRSQHPREMVVSRCLAIGPPPLRYSSLRTLFLLADELRRQPNLGNTPPSLYCLIWL